MIFLTLVIFAEVIYQQAGVKFVEADILTE